MCLEFESAVDTMLFLFAIGTAIGLTVSFLSVRLYRRIHRE